MRVLVVGAGAVGGYFGARLEQAGHELVLVARGEHGAAIEAHGLVIETKSGMLESRARIVASLGGAERGWAEVALVSVKARDLDGVKAEIGARLGPDGLVVSLLNGLDSERELAEVVEPERIFGGKVMIAAGRIGPGRLYVRAGGQMMLAPLLPTEIARAQRLAGLFSEAFPCTPYPSLLWVLYRKLLWNAPFNALCAITHKSAGEVLRVPELADLVRASMAEVVSVALAEQVELGTADIDEMIEVTHRVFHETTPSMLEDLLAGRPTEVDALQGAVVGRGIRFGIPTPVNRTLWALIRGLEHRPG